MRTILITGGSTGIGLAAARTLKGRGWRVFATARKAEDVERLEKSEGLEGLRVELTDPASIAAGVAEVLRRTGGTLDALYNNAGFGMIGAVEDVSAELVRRHLDVNVVAVHELSRLVVPVMRKQAHGRIVMCSSALGFVSGPYRAAYCASKFALEALSDALRMEVVRDNIHVSVIQPGPIESQFAATAAGTLKDNIDIARSVHRAHYEARVAEIEGGGRNRRFKLGPEAVVDKLIHALESPRPKARYKVGLPTKGAAILKRVLPDRWLDRIMSRTQ
jgi:NAD(P)-dependent dehydrogenase (short-subunit alcohol dehydrogenase family)